MDVVDAIAAVKTGSKGGHQDVPTETVVIESARRVPLTRAWVIRSARTALRRLGARCPGSC